MSVVVSILALGWIGFLLRGLQEQTVAEATPYWLASVFCLLVLVSAF